MVASARTKRKSRPQRDEVLAEINEEFRSEELETEIENEIAYALNWTLDSGLGLGFIDCNKGHSRS
jgi:hypothetical protein